MFYGQTDYVCTPEGRKQKWWWLDTIFRGEDYRPYFRVSDIHNRVKIGNESSADIFVSIHLNKIPQQQYDGWQTFYNAKNAEGQKLAVSIQNNLNDAIQRENNRVAKSIENIYIVKHVEIPTTIVECGFLSNPAEEKRLLEDEYQNKLAWGIYNGIIDYFYEQSN